MTCAYSQSGNSKCQFEHIEHVEHFSLLADGKMWCPFHAPVENSRGQRTVKGNWPDEYLKWFYEKISELRHYALQEQKTLDLSGVVFPNNADFQGVEFPEVDFHHARFEGEANFRGSRFSENANFQDVKFKDRAHFSHVKFNGGNTDFENAIFKAGAIFEGADFSNSDTNFKNAKFKGKANFRQTKFEKNKLDFSGVEFLEVDFSEVRFSNENIDFKDTRFNGRADFRDTYFEGNVFFQNTRFIGGEAIFWNAKFQQNADFSRTKFIGGDAGFNRAEFRGELVDFKDAYFSPGIAAVFSKAKFNGSANFFNSEFSDWGAFFENTEFSGGYVDFQNARFKGDATFLNAQFRSERIHFQDSFFKGYADFTAPGNNNDVDAFQGEVDFSSAEFLDEVSFNNRKFRQATSFRKATFNKAPLFHNCQLHQDTDFDAEFLGKEGDEAARAYRTLKQDMEEKRARQEQLRFYALEMKSRRSAEKIKFLKLLSWLYEATSDYGQRIFLPLAWLGFLFALFAFFYAVYFKELLHLDTASILSQSLHFSIKQIIRPFGLFGSSSLSDFFVQTPSKNLLALPLIIAAALQSFLSLALLLLSALAARWRFKIG